jgi:hypothetical protein
MRLSYERRAQALRLLRALLRLPGITLRTLFAPAVLCVLLTIAALALATAGAYLLLGLAAALIAAAVQLWVLAYLIARGITHG